MSNWQNFHSLLQRVRYSLIFLAALWLSLGVPGCSFSPPNSQISASPQSTQINPTAQRFDGVTINVITQKGVLDVALNRHIGNFESLTGAKVNMVAFPFGDLYKKLQQDWSSRTPKYDMAVILSKWLIDFINTNDLEDLTNRVQSDFALQWQDIAPIFRDVSASYKQRIYAIPLDGDFHMVYYRSDLLKNAGLTPPTTWDDYLAIAKQFHGKDLNNDGKPDYGSCMAKGRRFGGYLLFTSIASSFLQSQGTTQGGFFDLETMKPLVENPAFAKALNIYKKTMQYGPPNEANLGIFEERRLFTSGRCALTLEWGDIGTLAINPATSKVIDKVGAVVTPGSTQVLDRKTGTLVACDKFTCPYAIAGVNHAPFTAFVGWAGVVHAKAAPTVKDAAYAFLSYMSQPAQANVDVTIGKTGANPYRISQVKTIDTWVKAGMSPDAANNYLSAMGVSLNTPNIVLDLRIPHNQQYQLEVLDAVLADFLAGKLTTEEVMQQIEHKWEQITNQVGRESQRAAYRASLGLTP
ncbi:putative bacterial extracellular solute-binding protein [Tolypothrix sp. NIES-4075]|uniref:ABC transporter substrate-binding protein n=1 Tax=Tolypothrix sp. NIES-4075 TaxID=2005459 RepID=UPI000B5C56D6|nr:extracellular solute-binding protein [Tolypothrix sp. NIES-4075]GAX39654.1 putative bacterial extracellular solute-binding protein [Tolypothrix sp. NIES-4075]